MLQVDLREVSSGPVDTHAELAGDDPLFEQVEVALAGPVRLVGRLHAAGEGRFYWRGSPRTRAAGGWPRCLAPGAGAAAAAIHAPFPQDPGALGDPNSYPPAREATPDHPPPPPRGGDLKRPHRVCPPCGYYRGEQRVAVED